MLRQPSDILFITGFVVLSLLFGIDVYRTRTQPFLGEEPHDK
jgi:hypothetical protein